jgi:hypothetical protein
VVAFKKEWIAGRIEMIHQPITRQNLTSDSLLLQASDTLRATNLSQKSEHSVTGSLILTQMV